MFNPTREQVRQFFFDAWSKQRERAPLTGLEPVAADIMQQHPEYHAVLDRPERYAEHDYTPESGTANPFLHLSMHLAIEEQLSIDQPPGIKAEFLRIARSLDDRHAACHAVMECLGVTVWRAQREGLPPDANAYLDCLKRR